MVALHEWIFGTARRPPDPAVVAEIQAIRTKLDELTRGTAVRGETLKVRIKALGPSHAREVLLASTLRLIQNCEEEEAERERTLGRCSR